MICSTLASLWKFNIFGGLYTTLLNIYDGAFIAKIVSRQVYSQESSFVDARLGSKYASAFTWSLFKSLVFNITKPLKSVFL